MFLSVALNPSIDTNLYLEKFNRGKLNRVVRKTVDYAGKGINTAVALRRLGSDSAVFGFVGKDCEKEFQKKCKAEEVVCDFLRISGRTRNNIKILCADQLTEINDVSFTVTPDEEENFVDVFKRTINNKEGVIFTGSIPNGVSEDIYAKLARCLPESLPFAVDSEGERALCTLKYRPILLKPNLFELKNMTNMRCKTTADIVKAANSLIRRGAKNVLVSMGKEGAFWVCREEFIYAASLPVQSISPVGAGDSMLAAAMKALVTLRDCNLALKAGVAAGAAAVISEGTNLFKLSDYIKFFDAVQTQRYKNELF